MSNFQYFSIGSDNGLAPNRRQAIIWTNDDPVQRCIYASLSLNELINAYIYRLLDLDADALTVLH